VHNLTTREKSILIGLYLSKYDAAGLMPLGFNSFKEACNALGLAIGANPSSIKNYRDELDPYFPNPRKGWHQRPLREHCKIIYDHYKDFDAETLRKIISQITRAPLSDDAHPEDRQDSAASGANSFAKRLITGKAAENYFIKHFVNEPLFRESQPIDVTDSGCGYDFELHNKNADHFAVEVKGLCSARGAISMTSKEYRVAGELGNRFFLYVVTNFAEIPLPINIRNPIHSNLVFNKVERPVIQTSWNSKI